MLSREPLELMEDCAVLLGRSSLGLLLVLVVGCMLPTDYRGDGDLSDRGPTTATDRYILDLGQVKTGTESYTLEGLPSVEFTVGLQIEDLGPEEAEAILKKHEAYVSLTLTTAEGESVFDQEGQLVNWVWTSGVGGLPGSFAYRRGEQREISQPDGGSVLQRAGVGADRGWGTYFEPRRNEEYRLEVTARSPADFFSSHTVGLVARGGGWK